jgi:hypothetical protein
MDKDHRIHSKKANHKMDHAPYHENTKLEIQGPPSISMTQLLLISISPRTAAYSLMPRCLQYYLASQSIQPPGCVIMTIKPVHTQIAQPTWLGLAYTRQDTSNTAGQNGHGNLIQHPNQLTLAILVAPSRQTHLCCVSRNRTCLQ